MHYRPKGEIFLCRQRVPKRIGMAKIMRLLSESGLRIASFVSKVTAREGQETGYCTQKTGFSGTIRTLNDQRFALAYFKKQARKQTLTAAFKDEIFSG